MLGGLRTALAARTAPVCRVTLLIVGLSVLLPAPASADLDLEPGVSVQDLLKEIFDQVFKVKPSELNGDFLRWLIAVPDFIGDPASGTVNGDLSGLVQTTTAIAFGVMTAVMTWAVIHYWLAGISFFRASGVELLEGITRTVGVALLILGWPWVFGNAVALANSISIALVDKPALDRLGTMLTTAMGSDQLFQDGVPMILGIVVSIATIVMVLGLAVTKIVLSVALAVLFVWMPIAFVLWPLSSLSFITQASIKAAVSLIVLQVLWAVCLATFLVIGDKVLAWGAQGSPFDDAVAKPFVAIALLSTMMMLTRLLLRLSSGGGGMPAGGGVSHMAGPMMAVVASSAHTATGPAGSGTGGGQEPPSQRPVDGPPGAVRKNSFESGGGAGGSPTPGGAGQGGAPPCPRGHECPHRDGRTRRPHRPRHGERNGWKCPLPRAFGRERPLLPLELPAARPGAAEQSAVASGAGSSASTQGQPAAARPADEQPAAPAGAARSGAVDEQASGAGSGAGRASASGGGAQPLPASQAGEGSVAGATGASGEPGGAAAPATPGSASGEPAAQAMASGSGSLGGSGSGGTPASGGAAGQPGAGGAAPAGEAATSGQPASGGAQGQGPAARPVDWMSGDFTRIAGGPPGDAGGADEGDDVANVDYAGILDAQSQGGGDS